MIVRGTTPTHTFTLPFDVAMVKTARVIYVQAGGEKIVKTGDDLTMDGNNISVTLSQTETLDFNCEAPVEIQVRVLTMGDDALNSDVFKIHVCPCLENEVLA